MAERRPRPNPAGRIARLTTAFVVAAALAGSAIAQDLRELGVTDDEIRNQRRVTGNSITFCINADSLMADFERDLAAEIATTLLLQFEIADITTMPPTPAYDFRLGLDDVTIFRLLANQCDAIMGYSLLSAFPNWITPSLPYLSTPTVMAVRSGEFGGLEDIPRLRPIGTRSATLADNYFLAYMRTLPETSRWERIFYRENGQLIDRLLDRSVDAILIWEPAILAYEAAHPEAQIDIIARIPFAIEPSQFVLALRPQEQFINLGLSDAIAALTADGTIHRLATEHGILPANGP